MSNMDEMFEAHMDVSGCSTWVVSEWPVQVH